MKYSVVINQFKRREYVEKAIESCLDLQKLPNEKLEVIVVTDFSLNMDQYANNPNYIENVVCKVSDIGYRYAQGLKRATGDWIFLLDDDDYFLPDKLDRYRYVREYIQVIKEYSGPRIRNIITDNKQKWSKWMKQVIKHHVDWHGSQYCFNNKFKQYLLANGIDTVDTSFDKYLFAMAMDDVEGLWLLKGTKTVKVNHSDSKMHSMTPEQKRDFYVRTVNMIMNVEIPSLYKNYTYDLNVFLSSGDKSCFNKIKDYLPLINRLYYEHIWKPYTENYTTDTS